MLAVGNEVKHEVGAVQEDGVPCSFSAMPYMYVYDTLFDQAEAVHCWSRLDHGLRIQR